MTRTITIFLRTALAIAAILHSGDSVAGRLEDETAALVGKLQSRLSGPSEDRFDIVWRLKEIGPEASLAVPLLVRLLENDDWAAPAALKSVGGEAVPHLITALGHERPAVRRRLCETIAAIGTDAESAVAALVSLVDREADPAVRNSAIRALGRTGSRSELALFALHHALDSDETAAAAADALRRFDLTETGTDGELVPRSCQRRGISSNFGATAMPKQNPKKSRFTRRVTEPAVRAGGGLFRSLLPVLVLLLVCLNVHGAVGCELLDELLAEYREYGTLAAEKGEAGDLRILGLVVRQADVIPVRRRSLISCGTYLR